MVKVQKLQLCEVIFVGSVLQDICALGNYSSFQPSNQIILLYFTCGRCKISPHNAIAQDMDTLGIAWCII